MKKLYELGGGGGGGGGRGGLIKNKFESREPPKEGGMNFLDSRRETKRGEKPFSPQIVGWGK